MKQLPWLVLGVVAGFLLGGLGPRRELAERDQQIAELQDRLVKAQSRAGRGRLLGATPVPVLDEALGGERTSPSPPRKTRPEPRPEPSAPDVVELGSDGGQRDAAPQDALEAFDLAADAQRLRARQTREALREQTGLNPEQLGRLDAIVDDMNRRLGEHADDLLDLALSGGQPQTSALLGVTHDVTGILYESQTQLEDLVDEQGAADAEASTTEIWNYVDLEVFRDAVEEAQASGALDDLDGNSGDGG